MPVDHDLGQRLAARWPPAQRFVTLDGTEDAQCAGRFAQPPRASQAALPTDSSQSTDAIRYAIVLT